MTLFFYWLVDSRLETGQIAERAHAYAWLLYVGVTANILLGNSVKILTPSRSHSESTGHEYLLIGILSD